ncbi:MAG TPA: nicotinate phosphoribosyltransferase, partial [Candidatus Jeotgalicoccus stercoravium]|nr:nicotinate phosphoribosyltransferase [Candidatus Jeotgalicoccus stercoravium]
DEVTILSLLSQGAKVDGWGIGTKLITAFDHPALGAVYKLAAIEGDNGEWLNRIKISGNIEKVTTPGKKKLYRIINKDTGMSEGDYITVYNEEIDTSEPLLMFHPVHTMKKKLVKNFEAVELLHDIFVDGELVYESPSVLEMQKNCEENLNHMWEETKRFLNPQEYPVDLSSKLWNIKNDLVETLSNQVLE